MNLAKIIACVEGVWSEGKGAIKAHEKEKSEPIVSSRAFTLFPLQPIKIWTLLTLYTTTVIHMDEYKTIFQPNSGLWTHYFLFRDGRVCTEIKPRGIYSPGVSYFVLTLARSLNTSKKKTKRLWSKTTWHLAVKGRKRSISLYDIPAKWLLRSWRSKFRLRAILSSERGEQRENVRASIAARSEEVAFPFACHLRVTSHDDADLIDLAKGV